MQKTGKVIANMWNEWNNNQEWNRVAANSINTIIIANPNDSHNDE
jgi:hypothetical protein